VLVEAAVAGEAAEAQVRRGAAHLVAHGEVARRVHGAQQAQRAEAQRAAAPQAHVAAPAAHEGEARQAAVEALQLREVDAEPGHEGVEALDVVEDPVHPGLLPEAAPAALQDGRGQVAAQRGAERALRARQARALARR